MSEDRTRSSSAPLQLATTSARSPVGEDLLRRAQERDVLLRSDPALAETLASLDTGMTIPPELFRAVAEVLYFVGKLSGK